MKIDEQWIRKAAGWRAMKEGKEIFARGVVTKASQNQGLIVGEISGGAKTLRVTLRIHSDTDIDTVCPRMACRRTGEICQHAVAVMLGVIHGTREKKKARNPDFSNPSTDTQPSNIPLLRVLVPPNFPKGLPEGGLSVKLEKSDGERALVRGDVKFFQWLDQNAAGKIPPMFGVKGKKALQLLKSLDGHPELLSGERQLRVGTSGVRIPMHVAMDDDRVELALSSSVTEHGSAWFADDELWLWDHEQAVLVAIDVSSVLNERQWLRVASGNPVFVPLKSFMQQMAAWQSLALWDDDSVLGEIPIVEGQPEFKLKLEGSTNKLRATLTANYTPEVSLTLGLFGANDISFPVVDASNEGHWVDRNRDAEDDAAGNLMRYGFQITGAKGEWELSGDDAVIDFLTDALPELEKKWTVLTGGKLSSIKGNLVRVRPHMNVQGSGEEWLAFDYGFQTDSGREIPREAIQKMLASGKRSATTKNGKQVVISQFDAEMMESVLRDTDPRQEGGKYYVPKNQGAYLKRVREYYQGESKSEPDRSILQRLPSVITDALRGYQEEGIAWLYERCVNESAALLADDMGLGKTLQTLAVLSLRQEVSQPSLVVCPTSLLANWADEAEKWAPQLKVQLMHGPQRKEHFKSISSVDVIITSYALVVRDLAEYQNLELNTLVLDEASMIRNADTQAAKALRKLNAGARVALTGTPVENAVRDLWSLYAFLLPGYLGSKEDFKNRYELALAGAQPDENVLRRLRLRVEPFMIRRTKAQVAKDLPQKLEQTLWCQPSKLQKEAYQEILRQGVVKVDELEGGRARMQMLTVLLRLRQASCDLRLLGGESMAERELSMLSAKLEMLIELLHEARRGGHRVLVFSQFTKMLGFIKEALANEGISFAYLDGATRDRSGEVKKFQASNGPDVFLISLKAGGYGLNLTAADTVVHFDPWWNPAVEAQATDRAYRIGQTKPVTVYKLIAKGTVEEKILRLQERKRGLIGAAIGDEAEPMMTGLNAEDMRDLLS
ncbi:MAG: DEAD/DEAH box helicase [Rubritalea sp.]|uniref:DEAD/DEAH box helicase n=1 Tax=Rubritalea sp. TaxID=2109375 RepID=UPI003242CD36